MTKSLEVTEAQCAAGRTAPRVSLQDIQNAIASTQFVTGKEALGAMPVNSHTAAALSVLTICLIVMNNGFTIVGKSAPASPENFDPKLGCTLAYEDAIRQIWPLMGFALRDKLAGDHNA